MFAAAPCSADTFCAGLNALAAPQSAYTLALPNNPAGQRATCRPSLALSGARHIHCSWSFGYRSDAAHAAFDDLIHAVAACLGPDGERSVDTSVNHPDACTLWVYDLAGQEFAVSLKDKGALQQTLVFVRVQQR